MEEVLATGLPALSLVDEEYRLAVQEAELRFVDDLIARITDPQAGWAGPWAAHLAAARSRQERREMPATRRALVVGAGIAGPAAAMALQKAGIDPVLFEATRASERVGAFLTVASNGVDRLGYYWRPGSSVPGFATPVIGLRSGSGKFLGRTRTGLEPPMGAPV